MPPPRWQFDGGKNRGGSTSIRGRVRSLHISGGRRWPSCNSQRTYNLGSCATVQTDGQTNGKKLRAVAEGPNDALCKLKHYEVQRHLKCHATGKWPSRSFNVFLKKNLVLTQRCEVAKLTHGFPGLFTDTSEHIRFYSVGLVFLLCSLPILHCCCSMLQINLTHVGFSL